MEQNYVTFLSLVSWHVQRTSQILVSTFRFMELYDGTKYYNLLAAPSKSSAPPRTMNLDRRPLPFTLLRRGWAC
jgi:hypothetical protein